MFLNRRRHARRRLRSLENPSLHAPAIAGLAGVHPALRVDRDHVRTDEFAGLASRLAEAVENGQVLPAKDPHALVRAVDKVQQALLGVARKLQAEAAPRTTGFRTDEPLQEVLPVLTEHLDAVAAAIRDVDEAVLGA